MTTFNLLLVALIQGITEFLPVSSSGHLILLPYLTGLEDQGQVIDVAAHLGTLVAVVLYFWRDVQLALVGTLRLLTGRVDTPGARLALGLLIATIPVIIAGFALKLSGLDDVIRDNILIIASAFIFFGLVLYWADQTKPVTRTAEEWSLGHAFQMGLWQVLALIPGTSRSGITITGARALGYERSDAARLAMLMSIPTIIAAGALAGLDLIGEANGPSMRDIAIVTVMSFVAALLALVLMMRLLRSVSYTPYVIYRVVLGVVLLWLALT